MTKRIIKLTTLIACCFLLSCQSFLDSELPSSEVRFEDGFQTEADLQELINSAYDIMANSLAGKSQRLAELLGEDVFVEGNTGFLLQVYNRATDFFNSDVGDFYKEPTAAITRANTLFDVIDGIEVDEQTRNRMIGEALAIRAISHFELVKLFAQPYGFTADNTHPGIVIKLDYDPTPQQRATVGEVYQQIIIDFQEAINLLPEENGIYLNKNAVRAFLSRVYFLQNDFENAATLAQQVIENSNIRPSNNLFDRYQQDGIPQEALFYLVSNGLEDNRAATLRDNFRSDTQIPFIKASMSYADLVKSNPNDLRNAWIKTEAISGTEFNFFTKYNLEYFNFTLISMTEIYLIAAESLAELNRDTETAVDYLNTIRTRAGLAALPNGTSALGIVQDARIQRRIEFGGEGINVFDLKRRGAKGENIFIRNAPWNCPGMALQFPASEITIRGFVINEEAGCN